MEISFAHGPDRTPFDVRPDAQVVAADAIPFHGIVPRGLRSWLDARGSDGPQVWERNAHRLHDHGSEVTAELRELRRRQPGWASSRSANPPWPRPAT